MRDFPAITADRVRELADQWDAVREGRSKDEADRLVRDCAERLSAEPAGDHAYLWTLGLLMTAEHTGWLTGDGVEGVALVALDAADSALRERACGHRRHPYEDDLDERHDHLARLLPLLRNGRSEAEDEQWRDAATKEQWLCPRNIAGYARVAIDIIDPGTVADVPPRLPLIDARKAGHLRSILWDYPHVDPAYELCDYAAALRALPDGDSRAGLVVILHAACWYAVSGRIRGKWVLDEMVGALEAVLPRLGDEPCAHRDGEHPETGEDPAALATVGVHLLSPGGRGVYRRRGGVGGWHTPLEGWLCPAFLAGLAREALDQLLAGRDKLFGSRDTAHLDAEYLLPDGRIDIDTLTTTYRQSWVTEHDELVQNAALWAARRYAAGAGDERERAVLLLLACWAVDGPAVDLPTSVVGVLEEIFEAVDPAPLDEPCPHPAEHPWRGLKRIAGRGYAVAGNPDALIGAHLNHFCAPEDFEAPDEPFAADAWSCPRHLAERVRDALEVLYEVKESDEEGAA
ncbi:hypothetical protein [Streptomyces sp. ME19-01-6]|uniref:hypothetical protein n=1 Tax=Streptomyces sp. ME19-01-6 TaxID=3028686 RepID=UPI0029BB0CA6|nr:hypothetical protein [Streptomyces sp. ME19-01-6]MDX3231434.1 hypothetical protein [Streptomyces sp. ME19-01-6]